MITLEEKDKLIAEIKAEIEFINTNLKSWREGTKSFLRNEGWSIDTESNKELAKATLYIALVNAYNIKEIASNQD